jgi:hypothetical protein
MPDQESAEARREAAPGTSRRGMLRGAAGIGAAGLAAGVFAGVAAGPASAATTKKDDAGSAEHKAPLTIHVHDARTGVLDVFTGDTHVRFTDHELAARLARAVG